MAKQGILAKSKPPPKSKMEVGEERLCLETKFCPNDNLTSV